MTFEDQVALLRGSKLMDRGWYARRFPDAAAIGMDPVEHYLRYGAALGRNPGPRFDTGFYRAAYPDVAPSGLNPLAHYLRQGAREGRLARPDGGERIAARRALDPVRRKLLGFGFVARGLAELAALAGTGATPALRAHAARELALWHLRAGGPEAAAVARTHLPRAADCDETPEYFARLAALELLCAHAAGAPEAEADAVLARATAAGWALEDILLARGGFAPDPAARIPWINRALARKDIAPVALAGTGATPYDRLACPAAGPAVTGGPLVSVLIAAFNGAATLPTALASLQAQRWRNLEILVIDDASPDDTAAVAAGFAAADPRIRLIRLERNGGAYVARNRGLAEARGEFVTLHDADDWSHPDKIAAQAEFLTRHPEVVGCTSERARATPDLVFRRMTGTLKLINMNTSSFMFRRAYVRAVYGGWDTARFGADTELITRISHADGAAAVRRMETGALSFQRVSDTSIVADAHFGISGTPFGARLIYHDLYVRRHREGGVHSPADPGRRPFPAPRAMRADRPAATGPRRCDLVFAGDLADPPEAAAAGGGSAGALAAEIARAADLGLEVAAFPVFDYDRPPQGLLIAAGIRDLLQAGRAELATYGEALDCGLMVLRDLGCFQDEQRFLPEVRAAAAVFVLRADELAGDPAAAARRLGVAAAAVAARFGPAPDWRPVDAAARAALAALPASGALAAAGNWDPARAFAGLAAARPLSLQL